MGPSRQGIEKPNGFAPVPTTTDGLESRALVRLVLFELRIHVLGQLKPQLDQSLGQQGRPRAIATDNENHLTRHATDSVRSLFEPYRDRRCR